MILAFSHGSPSPASQRPGVLSYPATYLAKSSTTTSRSRPPRPQHANPTERRKSASWKPTSSHKRKPPLHHQCHERPPPQTRSCSLQASAHHSLEPHHSTNTREHRQSISPTRPSDDSSSSHSETQDSVDTGESINTHARAATDGTTTKTSLMHTRELPSAENHWDALAATNICCAMCVQHLRACGTLMWTSKSLTPRRVPIQQWNLQLKWHRHQHRC